MAVSNKAGVSATASLGGAESFASSTAASTGIGLTIGATTAGDDVGADFDTPLMVDDTI